MEPTPPPAPIITTAFAAPSTGSRILRRSNSISQAVREVSGSAPRLPSRTTIWVCVRQCCSIDQTVLGIRTGPPDRTGIIDLVSRRKCVASGPAPTTTPAASQPSTLHSPGSGRKLLRTFVSMGLTEIPLISTSRSRPCGTGFDNSVSARATGVSGVLGDLKSNGSHGLLLDCEDQTCSPYLCKSQERTVSADRIQKDTSMPLKHRNLTCSPGCAVEATLDLIDGKWKGLILYHLLQNTRRFNELRRLLPNVTQRMLTAQLREMEMNGIIVRTVYPQVPPRVDYSVSELGQSLSPVISTLKAWADQHIDFTTGDPQGACWRAAAWPGLSGGHENRMAGTV